MKDGDEPGSSSKGARLNGNEARRQPPNGFRAAFDFRFDQPREQGVMKILLRSIVVTALAFLVVMATAIERRSSEASPVKKSRSGICHCPGGNYYEKTKNFGAFSSIEKCLASGGRHPRRGQGDCSKATPAPGSPEALIERKRQQDGREASRTIKRRDLGRGRIILKEPIGDPIQPATQSVQVIDGDTIRLDGQTIRLKGIDAPELDQECRDREGETQPCGQFARVLLMEHLASCPRVHCDIDRERDRYGRALGVCYVLVDINAWMVSSGLALAYRKYSKDYVAEEDQARAERRGIHQGSVVPPWDWRRGKRLP